MLHRADAGRAARAAALASLVTLLPPADAATAGEAAALTAPAVSVLPAARIEVVRKVDVVGSLVPEEDVVVSAEVGGYALVDLAAEEGDHVAAGQVLARLSAATLDIQLSQNAATLTRDEAAVAQARSQIEQMRSGDVQAAAALDRAQRLIKVGAGTQEILDQRLAAASTAKAQIDFAQGSLALALADKALVQAQRRELQLNRARTEIRAPVDGIILSRSAQIGALVSMTGVPLFHIARHGIVELSADIVEGDLAAVQPGQAALIHAEGGSAPLIGTVRLISPQVDKVTRLGRIRIALPAGTVLPTGLFARAEIAVDTHDGIVVPSSAVLSAADRPNVKLVEAGRVRTQAIVTGLRIRDGVEVVEGIGDGQAVVVRAGPFLHDGQRVTPVRSASAGDGQ